MRYVYRLALTLKNWSFTTRCSLVLYRTDISGINLPSLPDIKSALCKCDMIMIVPSWSNVSTTTWLHHLDSTKTPRENAQWELH